MMHAEWIEGLRRLLTDAARARIAGAPAVALLDFPAHTNVGDSAIWLGALRLLRDLEVPSPCYQCDRRTYDRATLARRIGRGTIVFTGGGSFGDLWERHLLFREQVVRDFPDNPILQLPESIHFRNPASLDRARATFDGHPDFTIMVRDRASLDIAHREFRAPCILAPDVALALGPLRRPPGVRRDVLWLKRRDAEDRWPEAAPPDPAGEVDWLEEPASGWPRIDAALRRATLARPWWVPAAQRLLETTGRRAAARRLARGVALLAAARVVVTDRLHGHILALLLGIPSVVLDNSYGKVHHFVETWTSASPLVRLASSMEGAAEEAGTLSRIEKGR